MESTLLRNKPFMTLMTAQLISSLGDWLSIVAIITMVGMKWNATPMEVSFVILCLALPMALLGPFTGTVADRVNRKWLMIVSDLVRAGLILVLAIASSIWVVYVCLFLIGLLSAVFIPAKNGKLKELVKQEDMKSAMSISSMIGSTTKVLGPLLSGMLVTVFGAQLVFMIDSATFFLSALLIIAIPKSVIILEDDGNEDEEESHTFKDDFKTGLHFIKQSRYLVVGMFVLGLSLMILQLSDSQIIVLVRELSNASPNLFGLIVTGSGLGMFLAGLVLTKKTDYNALLLMFLGVCGIGVSFGMMGLLTSLDLSFSSIWGPVLGFLAGISAGLIFIPFQASVQTETPARMTGRVFGVINSVTTSATIVGPLLGGWLATWLGILPTFMITASLLIVVSLIGLISREKIERGKKHVSESKQAAQGTTPG
ncbi:MFS transporter [Pontibacillus yanchengensis]|uniref:MFS transporter n=1 Tax=Pontibacillus yanchengensis Y32 TaxID=1385514 RepID=A0A0A2TBP6_9BACI|nr:MFS transporter [Pontibacillus yanchengensis]KGP73252.1 MFS transporter [Pontibacillus yanchengensis Y32]